MQAKAARARQERLFEARENALDRMTELEKERLQNRYGGEDAPKIAQLTQFYMDNIPGISREEAINRAEATGSASPANIRAQAISDFNDVRNEAPEFLRNEYGWERGKNDAEVRQQYVSDIVDLVQGGAGGGQQQGGDGNTFYPGDVVTGPDGRDYTVTQDGRLRGPDGNTYTAQEIQQQ
jgi:hypothetical protein